MPIALLAIEAPTSAQRFQEHPMRNRRDFLSILGAGAACAGWPWPARAADVIVIRVGTLKLIHAITPYFYDKFTPAGYKIEVIPYETPTDGKNAVVTKSVDFGTYGIAAATLGGAAGEPVVVVAAQCNRGMAIVVGAKSAIKSFKDLKGKKVAILPGSTQEVVMLNRLKQEGMSIKDITPVRVPFSEMPATLERGDVDAYVGAEPGPSISVAKGVGRVLEYPYGTPIGTLNMVMTTHEDTVKSRPELVKLFLEIHRKATEYAMANRGAFVDMTVARLGQPKPTVEIAAPNVELTWDADAAWVTRARYYGAEMLEMKQIRALPDYGKFINTSFVEAMRKK
jgi:NitT/TauT family transport system substrate-binding protein